MSTAVSIFCAIMGAFAMWVYHQRGGEVNRGSLHTTGGYWLFFVFAWPIYLPYAYLSTKQGLAQQDVEPPPVRPALDEATRAQVDQAGERATRVAAELDAHDLAIWNALATKYLSALDPAERSQLSPYFQRLTVLTALRQEGNVALAEHFERLFRVGQREGAVDRLEFGRYVVRDIISDRTAEQQVDRPATLPTGSTKVVSEGRRTSSSPRTTNRRPRMPLKDSIIRATMGVPTRHMKVATRRWEAHGWL